MKLFMCKTSKFTIYRYLHQKKVKHHCHTRCQSKKCFWGVKNNVLWQTESQSSLLCWNKVQDYGKYII